MPLKNYLATLQALIAETPFVNSTSIFYEERPPTAGLVKGTLAFADGSQLDFKEFIITQPTLLIVKYAYNYRRKISSSFVMTMPMTPQRSPFPHILPINMSLKASLKYNNLP